MMQSLQISPKHISSQPLSLLDPIALRDLRTKSNEHSMDSLWPTLSNLQYHKIEWLNMNCAMVCNRIVNLLGQALTGNCQAHYEAIYL